MYYIVYDRRGGTDRDENLVFGKLNVFRLGQRVAYLREMSASRITRQLLKSYDA